MASIVFIMSKVHAFRVHLLILLFISAAFLLGVPNSLRKARAQAKQPVLVSESTSTRAIALESITQKKEPFSPIATVNWGTDNRTRIMLFAMNLSLNPDEVASAVSADAEDGNHQIYEMSVESVAQVPDQNWLSSVTIRLNDDMGDIGDVLVRVNYHGVASNRVRVGIGHIGDGAPDDPGSIPTPGSPVSIPGPTPNPNQTAGNLTSSEVQTIISQAVSAAVALNSPVTVAVVDHEGNVLGVFKMTGATDTTRIRGGGVIMQGLEGLSVPGLATLAAISKAGTAAFFSTTGNAFTTRTAGFIIQEHFPPGVNFQAGGPLFGVQFSSLPCSDIKRPVLPLGLAADPGSAPIYKNGVAVGGVGIEGDGLYGIIKDPTIIDKPFEEIIAVAAQQGFEPPPLIRGDNIIANGIRLAYLNVTAQDIPHVPTIPFASLSGVIDPRFPVRGAQPSAFVPATVGGIPGEVDPRFFPFIGSSSGSANALSAADVQKIISQAAQQANITRAAIRQPLGSSARVSITVVDRDGHVLGIFRTADAPVFGFDVSAQKARTAALNSNPSAGALYRAAGMDSYVDRAAADGLRLDGSVAFSDRAGGFLHRPFFPDGIDQTPAGPFSTQIGAWSVFNVGLQLDLIKANFLTAVFNYPIPTPPCSALPNAPNGIQIFPGSVPLYRNGELVGGIGISGDGVDQDDIISAAGSAGFEAPAAIRADQVFVRGTRLPYVKFPRSPDL